MREYKVETMGLVDKVYNNLKEMILNRELVPGQKLVQEEIATKLGVSRTPILSAFSKLEKELLVKNIPRRGFYINELSSIEKVNLFDIRLGLEPLGARKAAELGSALEKEELVTMVEEIDKSMDQSFNDFNHHDYQFHNKIMIMSQNKMLSMMLSSYNIISLSNQNPEDIDYTTSLSEHLKLAEAIESGDSDKAEKLMHDHIFRGIKRLERNI